MELGDINCLSSFLSLTILTGLAKRQECINCRQQRLDIVKGVFLTTSNQQQAPTQPKVISKGDDTETCATSPQRARGRFTSRRRAKVTRKHFVTVRCLMDANLEEPFVLWKSTCPCQNAFKWTESERSTHFSESRFYNCGGTTQSEISLQGSETIWINCELHFLRSGI